MTVNPLPPQAYTKETLQKAYSWLLNQGASIKDMATSQDMLVSLYLKAQRSGDASLDTPSIQNFKLELKNLAHMIGDLQPNNATAASTNGQTAKPLPVTGLPLNFKEAPSAPAGSGGNNTGSSNSGASSSASLGQLDIQSLQALSEVRQTLNLSSDIEALRALIALGYKQFKKM